MTEADIIELLTKRYGAPEWAFIPMLRVGTGYTARDWYVVEGRPRNRWERTMDAWAINCFPSKGLVSVAFEVKTNRADFLSELRQPWKRIPAMDVSNLFYFVAPVMTALVHEIPTKCGLIEVNDNGKLYVAKKATKREIEPLPLRFVASIARRAST